MDGIAATLILKIVIMMLIVIMLFVAAVFFFKKQVFTGNKSQHFKMIDTIFINNKDRILNFHYKENAYLLYINPTACVLLDKKSDISPVDPNVEIEEGNLFRNIINKVYK